MAWNEELLRGEIEALEAADSPCASRTAIFREADEEEGRMKQLTNEELRHRLKLITDELTTHAEQLMQEHLDSSNTAFVISFVAETDAGASSAHSTTLDSYALMKFFEDCAQLARREMERSRPANVREVN